MYCYKKNNFFLINLLFLYCLIFLNSCHSVVTKIDGDVKNIIVKVTTRDEIEKNHGIPAQITYIMGKETYIYNHISFKSYIFFATTTEIKNLIISFEDDKTVSSYTFFSNVAEDKENILNNFER